MDIERVVRNGSLKLLLRGTLGNKLIRHAVLPFVEEQIEREVLANGTVINRSRQVQRDKCDLLIGMLHGVARGLDRGVISRRVLSRLCDTFMDNVVFNERYFRAAERLGFGPPAFLLISPGKKCNLHCTGCYACSDSSAAAKLDWDTFDRILREKEELWESYFPVISGGEPFLWSDGGRGLLDMVAAHPKQFFLVYTNGTLITESVSKRLAELGNLTPAISVEGFEAETDLRRGKGTHKRILRAMDNLRKVGVPFGISVTATRDNVDLITSDRFVDFYFDEQAATYQWVFQYMPIGRGHVLGPMLTPQQRLTAFNRTWRTVRRRKVFIADFWNSGTASDGCICAGRPNGGYFYITWDGAITPCAFVPYSTQNIHDIYRNGGDLDAVLHSRFIKRIRRWQDNYGFAKRAEDTGNWLCPCIIRDHFDVLLKTVRQCDAKPIDQEADAALSDPEYHAGMIEYGRACQRLSDPLWSQRYQSGQAAGPSAAQCVEANEKTRRRTVA